MSKTSNRLSREDVIAAYEVILRRKPENEKVIDIYRNLGIPSSLIRAIALSDEYKLLNKASPFFYYNSNFDPQELILKYAVPDLKSRDKYLINFLGVMIDCKFLPNVLEDKAGQVECIPIPANWHADIAEWGAVLRAVDLAEQTFTVAELGCGWGCWMNNSGIAAQRRGLKTHLIGVEEDEGHIEFAREACSINGFSEEQFTLFHGIAAATAGAALFPRQATSGVNWGLEPVFHATEEERQRALFDGTHDELPMISTDDVIGDHKKLDLLHVDIQGGEADLVEGCLETLSRKVSYMVIGTHSRQIEGRIMEVLLRSGWTMEIERPATLKISENGPMVVVDGVQGWRNTTRRLN
jgi:FkbM family methyltransferase